MKIKYGSDDYWYLFYEEKVWYWGVISQDWLPNSYHTLARINFDATRIPPDYIIRQAIELILTL